MVVKDEKPKFVIAEIKPGKIVLPESPLLPGEAFVPADVGPIDWETAEITPFYPFVCDHVVQSTPCADGLYSCACGAIVWNQPPLKEETTMAEISRTPDPGNAKETDAVIAGVVARVMNANDSSALVDFVVASTLDNKFVVWVLSYTGKAPSPLGGDDDKPLAFATRKEAIDRACSFARKMMEHNKGTEVVFNE